MTPFAKYWTLSVKWRHEKHVTNGNERLHARGRIPEHLLRKARHRGRRENPRGAEVQAGRDALAPPHGLMPHITRHIRRGGRVRGRR